MEDFYRSQPSQMPDSQVASTYSSQTRNGLLPRRFTTDSGRVPTLSTISTSNQRAPEPQDYTSTAAYHKVQLLEKKRLEYERIRESKRRFAAEISRLEAQERQEELELVQMTEDLRTNGSMVGGHQSEPTTPPEYRETSSGFPTLFSRPNRYSTSILVSPPGLGMFNRASRSGSQLGSPQSAMLQSRFAFDDQLPSRSVPGSRRNSDEDEKEEAVRQDPTSHRATAAHNRYSMPVTRSRPSLGDLDLEDSNNTTGFLFNDEDNTAENRGNLQTNISDTFSNLFRQSSYSRNMSVISSSKLNAAGPQSPEASSTNNSRPSSMRHSQDAKFFQENLGNLASLGDAQSSVSSSNTHIMATPPKLQQSFSANELPTPKTNGSTSGMAVTANNHAQQYLHNHNASIGRIPAGAIPNRHSREMSGDSNQTGNREVPGFPSIGSTLQANAAPFGPTTQPQPANATTPAISPTAPGSYPFFPTQPHYGNGNYGVGNPAFNMGMLMQSMQGLSINQGNNVSPVYSSPTFTNHSLVYQPTAPSHRGQDSQARVIQNRRQLDGEAMARFNTMGLQQAVGNIYALCKDQHGCRFLQRQIETRNPDAIHTIWLETHQHVVELMTDPFGNYLCQKLLEYCDRDDRTALIKNASSKMVEIAMNQHGTRALQKMIEAITERVQIQLIIDALRDQVVKLIQDLNGNHVIQKCLNKLSSDDAHFIFAAVGEKCVEVGTHRHGCCVLQRCIDHAQGETKTWLVEQIINHACQLVQDPFGNYVVQYIIDLNEDTFTEPLIAQFRGSIVRFSRQKFSSNVVEKCLRCATDASKAMIVQELLTPGEMERLLRDSFANYVIQTALEQAPSAVSHMLVEAIRPHLPNIRTTPYGRHIQTKVQAYENRSVTQSNGQSTPSDSTMGQIPLRPTTGHALATNTSILTPGAFNTQVNGGMGSRSQYPHSSIITVPPPAQMQGIQAPPQPPRNQQFAPGTFNAPRILAGDGEVQWF